MLPLLLLLCAAAAAQEIGSKACAACHPDIARRYAATGMARSSGAVGSDRVRESFEQAAFQDAASGAYYRVSDRYLLSFHRDQTAGERALRWFVGSGNVGRSYLYEAGGFLYQSPVSYYSSPAKWDASPGYHNRHQVDLTRAVEPACLQCHASRVQPTAGTQNRYAAVPFLEGGISCERCHSPGAQHAAKMKSRAAGDKAIVNPAKLDAARRDSVCAQCHLTGVARVARAGATRGAYRPGALLSDTLAVFVWADAESAELTATSHFEKLARSKCKLASGEKLWCGTCHDPHAGTEPAAYRAKCLSCHNAVACKEQSAAREAAKDDCVRCHMPRGQTRMGEHVAYTDHAIPRRPASSSSASARPGRELASFWRGAANDRDLALGYAVVAMTEPAVRGRALELLEKAAAGSSDVPVLSQLAQFYDRMGRDERAAELCERILKAEPGNAAAAANLGIFRVKRGEVNEAIALWEKALAANPAQSGVRMNLAVARFRSGDVAGAKATLEKALEYDPDLEAARKMLAEMAGR
ncbi:MAG: tetratricopeptide repeat protein [Bryobacteraceae bacterium]